MARTTLAKSKTRIICLTDTEEEDILQIGNGSRTAGVRKLLDLIKDVSKELGNPDLKEVMRKIASKKDS